MIKKKHTLQLTDLELLALIDCLDNYSSMADGVLDKSDLRRVDKMLLKNGFKRTHT